MDTFILVEGGICRSLKGMCELCYTLEVYEVGFVGCM